MLAALPGQDSGCLPNSLPGPLREDQPEALRKEDICRNVPEQVREELEELLGVNFDTHLIEEVKKAEEDDEKYYSDRIDWYKYVTGREEYKHGDEYELRNKEEK